MTRLAGRRVLVVGASRGIGRAVGLRCSREGAAVAFAARTDDDLRAAVSECDGDAVAVPCDVRDEASCRAAVHDAVEALGGLDALVYCAAMTRFVELADAGAADWHEVFGTNVIGAGLVTAAAVGHLRASSGRAVYFGTESALWRPDTWRGIGLYIASKLALESMIRSWHLEVPEVAFTHYIPGATLTEFGAADADSMTPFLAEWFERGYVTQRILDADVHARAVIDILTTDGWVETMTVRPR